MKTRILFLAALVAILTNLSSCAAGRHHKDKSTDTMVTPRDEQDHMHDNAPR